MQQSVKILRLYLQVLVFTLSQFYFTSNIFKFQFLSTALPVYSAADVHSLGHTDLLTKQQKIMVLSH